MKNTSISLPGIPALPGSPTRDFYVSEETASHALSAPVRALVLEIEKEEASADPLKGLRIAASLHLLLYHLCQAFPPEETKKPLPSREDRETQKRMIHYINENFGEKITLDAIAAAGQVSKSKCSSLFRTYIGLTPIDYVNEYRLGVSRGLLEKEDTPIADIAYTCGFTSQSYFTKLFRQSFHMTPREYRAAARKI